MKKFRWQLLILFVTGLVVGILLILENVEGSVSLALRNRFRAAFIPKPWWET